VNEYDDIKFMGWKFWLMQPDAMVNIIVKENKMEAGELLMVRNVLDAVATGTVDMEDVVGALEIVEAALAAESEEQTDDAAPEVSSDSVSPEVV